MNASQQNYANLIGLWKRYGATEFLPELPSLWCNQGWPYRCWIENPEAITHYSAVKPLLKKLGQTAPNTVHSLCQHEDIMRNQPHAKMASVLIETGFQHTFSQVAMHLPLKHWTLSKFNTSLDSTKVISQAQITEWASIGSDAFGYEIDPTIIENVNTAEGISCLLFELKGTAVATALLYQSGSIMGVHQIAVRPEFQGQGIARRLMTGLLNHCKKQGLEAVTLQASDAGKHLYTSLGFITLFDIHNYAIE